jgi:uncharacterized membrane protein (DUF373 family)
MAWNDDFQKNLVKLVERVIIRVLIVLMLIVLIFSTLDLIIKVVVNLIEPPIMLIDHDNLFELFGVFLMVLIGIELLDTIKAYFKENIIHVEVVMLVALIALARKIIVLDMEKYKDSLWGIAALIIALSVGYYLIKKTDKRFFKVEDSSEKRIADNVSRNVKGALVKEMTAKANEIMNEIKDMGEKECEGKDEEQ